MSFSHNEPEVESDVKVIKIGTATPEAIKISKGRLVVVIAMFALAFCVLSIRVLDLSIIGGNTDVSSNASEEDLGEQGEYVKTRADIVDRNGILLAVNLSTASLYANPKVLLDVNEAVKKIITVFPEMKADSLKEKLASDKNFVWIKRNLTPDDQYKVNALGIPGLYFKSEDRRVYPYKNLLSHVLGFVGIDGNGLAGIEKGFDSYLKGKNSSEGTDEPLRLSVDIRAQSVVHEVLANTISEFKAQGGTAIVMDANTGEVISLASFPDFDPNDPGVSSPESKFNRATSAVYEMGSTFKTFNMALGFELGAIDMKGSYDVSEPIHIGRFFIKDFHPKKGRLTIPEIFMYSSNIGSVKIALDVGAESQRQFLHRLGLLSGLDIELPEVAGPLYPSKWSKISSMTISYGHGIAVTPIHVIRATAALVNGGILHKATILKQGDPARIKGDRVVSKLTSDRIRKLLRLVVEHGTGDKADAEGYLVGGKTGTADKPDNGKYNTKSLISSFIGAFPMNKPKYVVFAMVDQPVGNKKTGGFATGGMVAAPAVKEIIERISPILGVMPVDANDAKIRKEFWYDYEHKSEEENTPTAEDF